MSKFITQIIYGVSKTSRPVCVTVKQNKIDIPRSNNCYPTSNFQPPKKTGKMLKNAQKGVGGLL